MYAIVKTGGKQYKVAAGDTIKVEHLDAKVGEDYALDQVTLIENNGNINVGKPFIKNAKVVAQVMSHGKGRKLVVFFYRHKTNHRRRKGHRQEYTQLKIKEIVEA
ncbi:MAG TPA: 50S ribosomal protein L21 [Caldisericia bacterium]|nr:MAG: 50S ribosomal protein L21 [bacterium ADurb.Bin132]HNW31113.1 50S ribosomal protein L21 [Caldisericia bacterium]HNY60954.1 50S ribosomal protein L21 [Caldisericia bacterium]HOC78886.1 50S ribosomal protein L21 [Caldisericia bacterium]HOG69673.1 50S ribosomal protein L21 [Caldisericia bacterium]